MGRAEQKGEVMEVLFIQKATYAEVEPRVFPNSLHGQSVAEIFFPLFFSKLRPFKEVE